MDGEETFLFLSNRRDREPNPELWRERQRCSPLPQAPAQTDARARILVQVTIIRRLLIGRDGHRDQSEAYDLS